jgi:hypothetical protein
VKTETHSPFVLCLRRWHDTINGNSYYSFRVIGQGQDITAPFSYGYGDETPKNHACDLLGLNWLAMDHEQRRACFIVEETTVRRRKDLHNEGRNTK